MGSGRSRLVALVGLSIPLCSCEGDPLLASGGSRASLAAAMLGTWSYASAPVPREEPSLNAGLHVTIAIDSVDGSQFRGRVTLWFAGDVGLSPEAFGPVAGSVDGDTRVTLVIPSAAAGGPTLTMLATLAPNILTVLESRLGGEPGPFPVGARFERTHPPQEDP